MKSDLYFILNPTLGIIKIGIAGDAKDRRRTLAAAKKRDGVRKQQREEDRARAQEQHDAMIAREWEHFRKLHRPETGEPAAVRRHIVTEQRKRNAELIGTTPIQNLNETQQPRREGEAVGVNA